MKYIAITICLMFILGCNNEIDYSGMEFKLLSMKRACDCRSGKGYVSYKLRYKVIKTNGLYYKKGSVITECIGIHPADKDKRDSYRKHVGKKVIISSNKIAGDLYKIAAFIPIHEVIE